MQGGPSVGTITLGPSPLVTTFADAEAGPPVRVDPTAVRRGLARLEASRVVVVKGQGSATVARLLAKALGGPGRREEGGALVLSAGR